MNARRYRIPPSVRRLALRLARYWFERSLVRAARRARYWRLLEFESRRGHP